MVDDGERQLGELLGQGETLREGHARGETCAELVGHGGEHGVSTMPGAMVMTRMPCWARSRAAGRASPTMAPLEEL